MQLRSTVLSRLIVCTKRSSDENAMASVRNRRNSHFIWRQLPVFRRGSHRAPRKSRSPIGGRLTDNY